MAIKPVYIADERTLVWGSDDDVVVPVVVEAEAAAKRAAKTKTAAAVAKAHDLATKAESARMSWHEVAEVKAGPTATRVRARGLTRPELLSVLSLGDDVQRRAEAARRGIVSAQGPGVPVEGLAEWLPPAAQLSLGRWVLQASMLDDPPPPAG